VVRASAWDREVDEFVRERQREEIARMRVEGAAIAKAYAGVDGQVDSVQPTCGHASGRCCLLLPARNARCRIYGLPTVASECRCACRVQIPAAFQTFTFPYVLFIPPLESNWSPKLPSVVVSIWQSVKKRCYPQPGLWLYAIGTMGNRGTIFEHAV
jgi:hypothetical protein